MELFKVKMDREILMSEYLQSLNFGIHRFNELLNQKKIKINNQVIWQDQKLKKGDKLQIDLTIFHSTSKLEPIETPMNLHVLYEDDYLMVVDKPSKMIIYPDQNQTNELTLAHLVSKYYEEKGIDAGIYHIHRLDKDTRGCILYAKDLVTLAALSKMMEEKTIVRNYLAIVEGHFRSKKGIINKPIARDRHHNKMICATTGKNAITTYEVLKEYHNNTSLIKASLKTGRTHQIRVHFASIGHPLVNDALYNPHFQSGDYQLVSADISFIHPITGEKIVVNKSILAKLK